MSDKAALQMLVVENHEDTLMYLTLYLEQSGHRVSTARSLAEGRAALARREWDVVLSDIGLPDGSGWELLPGVSGAPFAIAMSGYGTSADVARSMAAGFRHHLIKPINPDRLDALLAEAVHEKLRDAG